MSDQEQVRESSQSSSQAAAPPVGGQTKGKSAWADEDDEVNPLKAFQTSDAKPNWAKASSSDDNTFARKRTRAGGDDSDEGEDEDDGGEFNMQKNVSGLLQSTAPILHTKHHRKETIAPRVLGIIPMSKDAVKDVIWHHSGDVVVTGGSRTVYVHHVTGKFNEKVAAWPVAAKKGKNSGSLLKMQLMKGGDSAIVVCTQTYSPQLIDLATGVITQLPCFDPRNGSAFRLKSKGVKDAFPTTLAVPSQTDHTNRCLVVAGQTAFMTSISTGTITNKLTLSDDISSVAFSGPNEVTAAARNKLYIFDVRNTARVVREFTDEGSIKISSLAFGATSFAVGSSSGVVNLYGRGDEKPTKSLMNITTAVDRIAFGSYNKGTAEMMAMASTDQANALRLVTVPGGVVTPSFPDIGMKHGFINAVAFNPVQPILTLAEDGRLVNYRMRL